MTILKSLYNFLQQVLPPESGINFATWMSFTLPLMTVNLLLAWIWLLQMPRWMSSGRNKDDEENIEVQPILNELTLHQTKSVTKQEKKRPQKLEG